MTARKSTAAQKEAAVDVKAGTVVRELAQVVSEIQKMRAAGKSVPEICEELQVSYHVVNQIVTQSYKMTMDTVGVFERQEKARVEGAG